MSALLLFSDIDGPCPTTVEFDDRERQGLPLITWAAVHRQLRAGCGAVPYEACLAEIEVEGLLRQAEAVIGRR